MVNWGADVVCTVQFPSSTGEKERGGGVGEKGFFFLYFNLSFDVK